MTRTFALSLILTTVLSACGGGDESGAAPGVLVQDMALRTSSGSLRYFDYYQPASLTAAPPLVIVYHGGQGNAAGVQVAQAAQSHWFQIADEEGLVLAFPNGTDIDTGEPRGESLNWNDCRVGERTSSADDVGLSLDLINWAVERWNVDPTRVFVTGASNGGMMSMRMAIEAPGHIRAFASFIASEPAPSECGQAASPVPAFILHGTQDRLIPFDGGCVAGNAERGCVRSAPATVALWQELHGLGDTAPNILRYPDSQINDASTVETARYQDATGRTLVEAVVVDGGGHQMPSISHRRNAAAAAVVGAQNGDVESVRLAWDFFRQL